MTMVIYSNVYNNDNSKNVDVTSLAVGFSVFIIIIINVITIKDFH